MKHIRWTALVAVVFLGLFVSAASANHLVKLANGTHGMGGTLAPPISGPVMYDAEVNGDTLDLSGFGPMPVGPYRWNEDIGSYECVADPTWVIAFDDEGNWYGAKIGEGGQGTGVAVLT